MCLTKQEANFVNWNIGKTRPRPLRRRLQQAKG